MLLSLLLVLLVVATLALFTIGALMAHQQQLDEVRRRRPGVGEGLTVTLGELIGDQDGFDDQIRAKVLLEEQARKQMAEILG